MAVSRFTCYTQKAAIKSHILNSTQKLRYMRCLQSVTTRPFVASTAMSEEASMSPCAVFLAENGLDKNHIASALNSWPDLSALDVAAKVQPLVQYLSEIGLSKQDLNKIIVRYPMIFSRDIEGDLMPVINFLRENLELSTEDICSVITKFPRLMSLNVKGDLIPQIPYLKSLGVPDEELPLLILERPLVLSQGIDTIVNFLRYVGVPRTQVFRMIRSYPIDYCLEFYRKKDPSQ